jgi:hypothetical protein
MSKRHYFITGLPRCRSAWLANLLTWDNSFCYHDGWLGIASVDQFAAMLNETPADKVGNSDPANVFFWEELAERFPEAKWVVVKRDYETTLASCQRAFTSVRRESLAAMSDRLNELVATLQPLVIDYEQLGDGAVVARYCGVDVPRRRYDMLAHLQVQIEPIWLKENLKRLIAKEAE